MTKMLAELLKKALTLSAEERIQLAHDLLDSVNEEACHEVEVAWAAKIAKRVRAYERGEATLYPAEHVLEEARRLTR